MTLPSPPQPPIPTSASTTTPSVRAPNPYFYSSKSHFNISNYISLSQTQIPTSQLHLPAIAPNPYFYSSKSHFNISSYISLSELQIPTSHIFLLELQIPTSTAPNPTSISPTTSPYHRPKSLLHNYISLAELQIPTSLLHLPSRAPNPYFYI